MSDIRLSCDLAIIGGGLSGGLLALALADRKPKARILLVEAGDHVGGNHFWSFFDGDIPAADRWLVDPLIAHRWEQGHDVRFPAFARTLPTPYNSIDSHRFDAHVRAALGDRVISGVEATAVGQTGVRLADGRTIAAKAVIDTRGGGDLSMLRCGWQKFVGQLLTLTTPHGLTRPVIMDATEDQLDGYRFLYLLPFSERTVFVEDTYYSDNRSLDVALVGQRIDAYAAARGWRVEAVTRQETGVLPVVMGGDFDRFWPPGDPVARAGACAGLFHPTTGYSLPEAVTFALLLAAVWPLDGASLARFSRAYAAARWQGGGYYRMLDRMLFTAAAPERRYRVFERFYRLGPDLIGRFYAGRSTGRDKIRILCGRPPVPIRGAMRALLDTRP